MRFVPLWPCWCDFLKSSTSSICFYDFPPFSIFKALTISQTVLDATVCEHEPPCSEKLYFHVTCGVWKVVGQQPELLASEACDWFCRSLNRRGRRNLSVRLWEAERDTGLWTVYLGGVVRPARLGGGESWEMAWQSRDTWKMKPIPKSPWCAWSPLTTGLHFCVYFGRYCTAPACRQFASLATPLLCLNGRVYTVMCLKRILKSWECVLGGVGVKEQRTLF